MELIYYLYFTGHLLLSAVLGSILGWQRVHIGKPAGPRTYALVSLGSTLFTLMSLYGFGQDTARVAAQILTGIGFLGAGIIMHRKDEAIIGLTTAAGLWVSAAIGMAVGIGWGWHAIIATSIIFLVMSVNDKPTKTGQKK